MTSTATRTRSRRGFWFSHIGWMLREYPSGRHDFTNIPDLRRDPMLAFQHRYYVPLALLANFGLPLLAGLAGRRRLGHVHPRRRPAPGVEPPRHLLHQLAGPHVGQPPYTEENTARDNPVLAVVTYGEGYHNFHHIFAHDYRNGVRWWQWDPTKWLIAGLQCVGLTRRLKRTPAFQIQRALLAMQFTRAQEKLAQAARRAATRRSSSCASASRTSTRPSSPPSPTGRASRSSGWRRRSAPCSSSGSRSTSRAAAGNRAPPATCSAGACALLQRTARLTVSQPAA